MGTVNVAATGISPAFAVSAEELRFHYLQFVTRTSIDGVQPPTLGDNGGSSVAFNRINKWMPWIDEKIVAPKYDGVAQYIGICSNRPTHVKDYHMIALMRAVDYFLAPEYIGVIQAGVDSVIPISPPTGAATVGTGN
jgi:hypothetical protein